MTEIKVSSVKMSKVWREQSSEKPWTKS